LALRTCVPLTKRDEGATASRSKARFAKTAVALRGHAMAALHTKLHLQDEKQRAHLKRQTIIS
jgi:hypothetical protein